MDTKPTPAQLETLVTDRGLADLQSDVLRGLAHPIRLRIVARLTLVGEESVGEIAETLDLPPSTVSRHLGGLRLLGVVKARQADGFRYYTVALEQAKQLVECMAQHADCFRRTG